jgi:hypothetical protein
MTVVKWTVSHTKNKNAAKFSHFQTIHICLAIINIGINYNIFIFVNCTDNK